ncbi:MAG: sigma-70 family RNA polymerase sigma factor [Paludibacteraceae bacterium]
MIIEFNKMRQLERIIDKHQQQLFSFAFFRVGSYAVAQDIVQEVFIKFYENSRRLSAADNVKAYLLKSISNACTDHVRKYGKFQFVDIELLQNELTDEDEKQCYSELLRIEDILSDLPAEQAEILRLKFVDSLNFVEIAELLNINVNTIKSRYKYAIEKLRNLNLVNVDHYE